MFRVAIRLLLITAFVYGAVLFIYSRLEQRMQVPEAALDQRKKQAGTFVAADAGPVQDMDYQLIVQRNIFQAVVNEPVPQKKKDREESLETTSLKLELLGTVSGNERDARAIIVDEKEKRQDIYHVGDAVQGAVIEAIERGKVILRVGDRREILLLKDRESKTVPVREDIVNTPFPPPSVSVPVAKRRFVPRGRPRRGLAVDRDRQEILPESDLLLRADAVDETEVENSEKSEQIPGIIEIQ